MLNLKNVSVKYGSFTAIHGINIEVKQGEIIVLLGQMVRGKVQHSVRLSGLSKPSEGEILFEGKSIKKRSADQIVEFGNGQCPEGRELFSAMSVQENLKMGAYVHRRKKDEIKHSMDHVYELFPILNDKKE